MSVYDPSIIEMLGRAVGYSPDAPHSAPAMLAQTFTVATYPTAANRFYGVKPVILTGSEAEGATGSTVVLDRPFYAYNLGGAIPPSGTKVLLHHVGSRWVFCYG